jgi:hypothetical protein
VGVARWSAAEGMEASMRVAMVFAVLVAAVAASANPIALDMYVDFDPPNGAMSVYPAPYSSVYAYVVADLGYIAGQDVYAIQFDVEVPEGTAQLSDFVPAEPGFIVTGIVGDGITIVAEDCISTFPAVLGHVPVLYLGVPGVVEIVPHPYNGHVFLTCPDYDEYTYCYTMGGGIGMEPLAPLDLCLSPTQDVAWSVIKAMYR